MKNKITVVCPSCGEETTVSAGKHILFTCPHCKTTLQYNTATPDFETKAKTYTKPFSDILVFVSRILVIIPLFILAHKVIPKMNVPYQLDRLAVAIIIILVVGFVFKTFRKFVVYAALGLLIWLVYGTYTEKYGFEDVYYDYKYMLYSLSDDTVSEGIILPTLLAPENDKKITKAIDFDNPKVRSFAFGAIKKNYIKNEENEKYRSVVQSLAIFKEIKNNWQYVSDPKSREYFAKASESAEYLAGDCDDYSILTAASIKSIGGTIRLVTTTQHIYPELLVGDKTDWEAISYLIRNELFKKEVGNNKLYYHTDDKGQVWLNLDYTARYPGGKFMSEEVYNILYVN